MLHASKWVVDRSQIDAYYCIDFDTLHNRYMAAIHPETPIPRATFQFVSIYRQD